MLTRKIGTGLILGLLLVSGNTFAADYNSQPQQQQGQQGQPPQGQQNGASRVPPEIAISVCAGKSEGTACEMSGPNGNKTGTCVYTPDKKYFACRPNDMKSSGQPSQR